jgi:hypothetical protein
MSLATWADGKPTLQRFAALSELLGEVNYTAARKAKMAKLKFHRRRPRSPLSIKHLRWISGLVF